jgi:hypothetical protein
MAKTCWLEREKRKQNTVEKYAALRAELKKAGDYVVCPCFRATRAPPAARTAAS